MVAYAGGHEVVKVMDFGIAKALGGAKRTATGSQLGTLQYMSPEQCEGIKTVDSRSDLYSIGVTLYEMATGRIPFERGSEFGLMSAHIREEVPPPSQLYPEISTDLEGVILKAMAKDPVLRFQTAREMIDTLATLDSTATVSAATPPQAQPVASPASTPEPPVPLAVPTPMAPAPQNWEQAEPEEWQQNQPSPTSKLPVLPLALGGGGLVVVTILVVVFAIVAFPDRREWHTFAVSPPVRASWVKVTILAIHPSRMQGNRRWRDSGISELEIFGL